MLATTETEDVGFDGAFINNNPLSWLARDDSKPGRKCDHHANSHDRWVLHASADWSHEHLEHPQAAIQSKLIEAMEAALGRSFKVVGDVVTHLWRYAIPANPLDSESLWDAEARLGRAAIGAEDRESKGHS